ncbi:hypothetical protein BBJ28_00006033 [Nothophytophthora sp. Chile5]|nr:hypothetical protein BBJ28_00006033 [Nothophytophthora sp. Chile5]
MLRDPYALYRLGLDLSVSLRTYREEPRLLVRLANTGRVVLLLERAVDSALGILNLLNSPDRAVWHHRLQQERTERVAYISQALLANDSQDQRQRMSEETQAGDEDMSGEQRRKRRRLWDKALRDIGVRHRKKPREILAAEMGDAEQQLEALLLLKHGLEKYSSVLLPSEMDLMSAVYDAVAARSNVVVGSLPKWFATKETEDSGAWRNTMASPVLGGSDACLRLAAIWSELNHPNVRKFLGACHSGQPYVIHEVSSSINSGLTWKRLLGCALGLQYVHDRGLVHEELTVTNLVWVRSKGALSGFGLVRRQSVAINRDTDYDHEPSVQADVRAFGLAVFHLLMTNRGSDASKVSAPGPVAQLPSTRPQCIHTNEWSLLRSMCATATGERINMNEVAYQMGVLARQEEDQNSQSTEAPDVCSETVEDVNSYEIPLRGGTLEAALDQCRQSCEELEDLSAVNRPVYTRLEDVYQQLFVASASPLPASLMETFSLILLRFSDMLERQLDGQEGFDTGRSVASICASKTMAGKNYGLHRDIDRLLQSSPMLESTAVHLWQPTWEQIRRDHHAAMATILECPAPALSPLESEARLLLQFETGSSNAALPQWFIPPYQLERKEHIADGSFGAVYHAQWLGADVVVKEVLTDQTDERNRAQYRRELDLWFSLNHLYLIKLFGACHVGRPFFVCERAIHGTLATFSQGKERAETWRYLLNAALGLQHLHDRGIVHGDLKGNNILVCEDGRAKLADFGLSSVANRAGIAVDGDEGALGAVRWKAPECLLGARPSFASDVYSLGMCIIEAVTGQFPWGTLEDVAVRFNVTRGRSLPQRPESLSDAEWELVTRMCRFDPQDRISVGAVICSAWVFRDPFEGTMWCPGWTTDAFQPHQCASTPMIARALNWGAPIGSI